MHSFIYLDVKSECNIISLLNETVAVFLRPHSPAPFETRKILGPELESGLEPLFLQWKCAERFENGQRPETHTGMVSVEKGYA